ncbi:MAG: CvpA family protein [bacterium]|nr:CvpA family protein [bacterium]
MLIDSIALGILVIFVILGLIRGTLAGVLRLTNLILAYVISYFASVSLGDMVGQQLGMSGWIGSVIAGCGSFVIAGLVLSVISSMILRGDRARVAEEGRSAIDRLGGGLIGGFQGALLVLLLGVLGNWLQVAQTLNADPTSPTSAGPGFESPRESVLTGITSEVVEAATSAAMGDSPEARITANLAARPAETMESLREFVESPQVASLQNDELFWQYVSTGAVDQALNRGSFRSISHDSNLRGKLADLGLISEEAREDPAAFRATSRDALLQIGPKLEALRNDPELQVLAANPEIQAALASGDSLRLLTNPEVRAFITKVTREGSPQAN